MDTQAKAIAPVAATFARSLLGFVLSTTAFTALLVVVQGG
jgi:hypothetical protein